MKITASTGNLNNKAFQQLLNDDSINARLTRFLKAPETLENVKNKLIKQAILGVEIIFKLTIKIWIEPICRIRNMFSSSIDCSNLLPSISCRGMEFRIRSITVLITIESKLNF